jgi:glycosyltransferase involved in cell wall biosynthesis
MKLSVIMPVYNERETVRAVLDQVQAVPVEKEIIIVDNFSTDGTREILAGLSAGNVRVVLQPQNFFKGTSVRKGIELAAGEYTIIQDADLEYDPQDYLSLLETAEREQAAAVFGSRVLGQRRDGGRGRGFLDTGNRALSRLLVLLYGVRLTDIATCYKLVRSDVLKALPLRCRSFDLDFELAAKLSKRARRGDRVCEIPIAYHPRTRAEGKKLRWFQDGLAAAWTLIRFRFVD